jgi:hypothetical protein
MEQCNSVQTSLLSIKINKVESDKIADESCLFVSRGKIRVALRFFNQAWHASSSKKAR